MISVTVCSDKTRWNQYAASNTTAKHSHLYEWAESLASAYNLQIYRLAAHKTKTHTLTGILPLILFEPQNKEKRLISLPYTDAAGILADNVGTSHELLLAAISLAETLQVNTLEFRQDESAGHILSDNPIIDSWSHTPYRFKTGLRRPLPDTAEILWSDLSAKVRNQIRKAWKCGCTANTGNDDLAIAFYSVFSENMRDLGSPVHDFNLFRNILANHSLKSAVIVVNLHNKPVAGAIVFLHNETLHNPWASSLRSYRPSCPNMLLYWSMMEYAIDHGCKWFDFGRSTPQAPTCRFKMQWGAEMKPLTWHVYSRTPDKWDPRNESLVIDAWKSMTLTDSVKDGPALRRNISL